jgi:lipoprotein-releasing system permease protein
MPFELFIARRYLSAKRKQVVISLITVISVIGVAAGVMALVIALAINAGFRNTLQRNLLGATAHVMILEKDRGTGIEKWEDLTAKLAKLPHVVSAEPGLYDRGYVSGPVDGSGAVIKGIPPEAASQFLPPLKNGNFREMAAGEGELPGIILGARMAETIGAVTGKQVQLLIPNGEMTPLGMRPSYVRLRVAGIFETGTFDIDSLWAYMALNTVQKAYGLADVVNSVELKLDDIYQADAVAKAAGSIIGEKLAASTWQEQNRQILQALNLERLVTMVTISLILIVAALNILITLVMMVMEKHRDIAILMSMGARTDQIRRIFLMEGALIGAVGTALGLVLGYGISFFAGRYHWIPLNEQVYPLAYVPFEPQWSHAVWIAAVAIGMSLVATLYPARNATRISPVEAMRYE